MVYRACAVLERLLRRILAYERNYEIERTVKRRSVVVEQKQFRRAPRAQLFLAADKPARFFGKRHRGDGFGVKAELTRRELLQHDDEVNVALLRSLSASAAPLEPDEYEAAAESLPPLPPKFRAPFRTAMQQCSRKSMCPRDRSTGPAKGIKAMVSGRLAGADIARTESYHEGTIPLQTLRADIDYGFAEAHTTYGIIGVKVWIYKGEILDKEVDQ